MIGLRDVLLGGFFPGALAFGAMLLFHALRGKGDAKAFGGACALGAGFAGGYVALFGVPFPPREALEWTAAFTPLALLFACVPSASRPKTVGAVRFLFLAVAWVFVLLPFIRWEASVPMSICVVVGLSAVVLAAWVLLERQAAKARPLSLYAVLFFTALAASVCLGLTGSQRLAQACGLLAAASAGVGAWFLASRARGPSRGPSRSPLPGASGLFIFLHAHLLVVGYYYSELPLVALILLFPAPFLLALPVLRGY